MDERTEGDYAAGAFLDEETARQALTHILSQEQWRYLADQQTPYWQNVQRDGVLLLPVAAGAL
jgi:hypothetical protein